MPNRPDSPRSAGPVRSPVEALVNATRTHVNRVAAKAESDAGVDDAFLGDYLVAALDAAAGARRLSPAVLGACRRIGDDAAANGVALSALLDLYLSATWRLWAEITAHAADTPTATVAAAAGFLFRAADDAAEALAEGYETAQRQTVRREESLRREFVDDLLAGSGDPSMLADRAARFGFNLAGTHLVAAARTDRALVDAGPVQSRVESHVLSTFEGRDFVVTTKAGVLVCVFPAAGTDPAADLLRQLDESGEGPWQVGLGRPYAGPGGLVRSYGEARDALGLARRLGLPLPMARFEALLPYRLLTVDPTTLAETVQTVLGPLERARGGSEPLIETLEAFFAESGNLSGTARRLHLSPRAVVYRLERIGRLTGHIPQESEGRFVLELAVRGRRLL